MPLPAACYPKPQFLWTPRVLSPALWLVADRGLFQDSGYTTPAAADGDPLGGWQDQSGNGRHATQATAAKRPVLKLAIQNGRPVVRFDSSDDTLGLGNVLAFERTDSFAVVLVVKQAGGIDDAVFGNVSAGAPYTGYQLVMETSGQARCDLNNTYATNALIERYVSTYNDAFHTVEWTHDGTSTPAGMALKRDGVDIAATLVANVLSASIVSATGLFIGSQQDTNFFGGDLGELVVCSPKPSDSQLARLQTYLRGRWGTP